jgi:putative transposase
MNDGHRCKPLFSPTHHGPLGIPAAQQALIRSFDFYHRHRPHSTLDGQTPDVAYFNLTRLPLCTAA